MPGNEMIHIQKGEVVGGWEEGGGLEGFEGGVGGGCLKMEFQHFQTTTCYLHIREADKGRLIPNQPRHPFSPSGTGVPNLPPRTVTPVHVPKHSLLTLLSPCPHPFRLL